MTSYIPLRRMGVNLISRHAMDGRCGRRLSIAIGRAMLFRRNLIMRVSSAVLLSTLIGILAAAPALAGTLDSRESEWAFDLSYTNQSSVGSTTNFRFAYGYLIGKGYSELGIESTYARLDDKTSG